MAQQNIIQFSSDLAYGILFNSLYLFLDIGRQHVLNMNKTTGSVHIKCRK